MQLMNEEKVFLYGNDWKNIRNTYISITRQIRKKDQERQATQIKSKKQEENWIEFTEIVRLLENSREEALAAPIKMERLQPYIALLLHVKQAPIRNDYHGLVLWDYRENEDNYLDWKNKIFVFNDFKNSKYMGQVRLPVKKEVMEDLSILVKYRFDTKCRYLFTNSKLQALTTSTYSLMLTRFTSKLTGKKIGSTLLRSIFVSHVRGNEKTYQDSKRLSKEMMHSESTSRLIYRKV